MNIELISKESLSYERFIGLINIQDNGCWTVASKSTSRYTAIRYNGLKISTHRLSYELYKGKIPDNYHIDHLCRNTYCCNPDHLEAVTPKENTLRGNAPQRAKERYDEVLRPYHEKAILKAAQIRLARTHCKRGHIYDEENTRVLVNNGKKRRQCIKCLNYTRRRHYYEFR